MGPSPLVNKIQLPHSIRQGQGPGLPHPQEFYIYGVDFYERGHLVGMKGRELDLIESNLVQEEKIP